METKTIFSEKEQLKLRQQQTIYTDDAIFLNAFFINKEVALRFQFVMN